MGADFHITGDTKLDGSGFQSGLNAMSMAAGIIISRIVSSVTDAARKCVASALKTGMSFDTAMSQVAATMGTTVDQIQGISDKAKEMGATTKYTATEAAEGMNILAMAGLSAEEQISGIETVLSLASAGAMDLASSASYVTGTVKGFADSMENAQYYADLMAKGATMANTDVSGLGEALSGSAATANAYGQSADSVTLSLLRLAEQNVVGSAAATAMNRAMADLYTPTSQAATALDQLGVSAYDAKGNARDFNDVVDDLNSALSRYSDEEANALKSTIFTTQGLNAFNKMTVSSAEKVEDFKKGLAGASEEFGGAGAAAGQAATQIDNLEGDLTLLSSATDGLALAFYNTFSDAARSVVQEGTAMVSELTAALESDGVPGVLSAARNIASGLAAGFVQQAPALLQTGVDTAVSLIDALSSGMAQGIPAFLGRALPMLVQFTGQLRENAGRLIDAGLNLVVQLAQGIADSLPVLVENVPAIVSNIAGIINDNAPKILATGIRVVVTLVGGIIRALPTIVANIPKIVKAIADVIQAFNWMSLGKNIVTGIAKGIKNLANQIPSALKSIVSTAESVVKNFSWLSLGRGIILAIQQGIQALAAQIPTSLKSIGTSAMNAFKSISWGQLGRAVVNGIAAGISGAAGKIVSAAKNAAKSALDAAKNFLGIKSPSRVFRDEVGKQIPAGTATGIEENTDAAVAAAQESAADMIAAAQGVVMDYQAKVGATFTSTGAAVTYATTNVSTGVNRSPDSDVHGQLAEILQAIKEGHDFYLDSGKWVGATANAMNTALGRRLHYEARGER